MTYDKLLTVVARTMYGHHHVASLLLEEPKFFLELKAAGAQINPQCYFEDANNVLFGTPITKVFAVYFAIHQYVPEADVFALYWYHTFHYMLQQGYKVTLTQHDLMHLLSCIKEPKRTYKKQWKVYYNDLPGMLAKDHLALNYMLSL